MRAGMPRRGNLRGSQRAGSVAELHADERREMRRDQGEPRRNRPHHREGRCEGRPRVQKEVSRTSEPGPRGHPRGLGILLVQLGTPDAPTPQALRPYLRQFLSDPRVIEVPAWKWKIILNLFILPRRPAQSAAKYQRIWDPKTGSPLLHWTRRQTELLQQC